MSDFSVSEETKKVPYGMVVVGSGVIVSCLLLCALFGWGIYLDLQRKDDCAGQVELLEETDNRDQVATQ
ncbi:MAG: hypothetical protein OXC80_09640 [Gammaproteobacteria bacterium]|nr:hypothetical protein [Gammaproteobacteria bacterium]